MEWSIPPASGVELGDREVHVWRAHLTSENPDRWRNLLSPDERTRADRFKFSRDRDCFTVARGILRTLLGRYLRRSPRAIKFAYGEYGKPELADHPTSTIHFNLSHSGEMALWAVGRHAPVGIDIERVRSDYPGEAIAKRFFSAFECEQLDQIPNALKSEAFFRCWTRKEAFVKALGGGLAGVPLDQFDVELRGDRPAALLATRWNPKEAERWTLLNLSVHAGYCAAVIARCGTSWQCWDWDGERG
ncbi:MAG: 4'-phosphopantetheinyl transferase superfamily protein [Cyanobacteria bacterium J06639_1]